MRSELCCSLLLKENVRPVYRVFLVQSILPRPDSFFVHSHLFYFNIYLHSPRTRGLMDYIDRYAVDGFHPSEKGHTVIAGLIKKLVERIGVPAQPRMGKLLFTDSCHSWIQGGGGNRSWYQHQICSDPKYAKVRLRVPARPECTPHSREPLRRTSEYTPHLHDDRTVSEQVPSCQGGN